MLERLKGFLGGEGKEVIRETYKELHVDVSAALLDELQGLVASIHRRREIQKACKVLGVEYKVSEWDEGLWEVGPEGVKLNGLSLESWYLAGVLDLGGRIRDGGNRMKGSIVSVTVKYLLNMYVKLLGGGMVSYNQGLRLFTVRWGDRVRVSTIGSYMKEKSVGLYKGRYGLVESYYALKELKYHYPENANNHEWLALLKRWDEIGRVT